MAGAYLGIQVSRGGEPAVVFSVVDPDPGSVAFLPPGSGIWIRDEFFPDPGSKGYVMLFFIPIFMYSRIRDPRSGIRIRDKKVRDPDPRSGIKHLRSATLVILSDH
jgi:hypothetical protein